MRYPSKYIKHIAAQCSMVVEHSSLKGQCLTLRTKLPDIHDRTRFAHVMLLRWPHAHVTWLDDGVSIDLAGRQLKPTKMEIAYEREIEAARAKHQPGGDSHQDASSGGPDPLCTNAVLHRKGRDPGAVPGPEGGRPRDPYGTGGEG